MCGRYRLDADPKELAEAFGLAELPEPQARYNIAPTQDVVAVRLRRRDPGDPASAERRLVRLRWGLVPHFAADPSVGPRSINARSETVDSRPAFRDAFVHRRCIVPARGFYEWRKVGRGKQPYLVRRRDGRLMGFAGLWARWRPAQGPPLDSCAILTTAANRVVAPIHDRMPVVLDPARYEAWLEAGADPGRLKALLAPAPEDLLETVAVSTRVNDVANDDPGCADPVEIPAAAPPPRQKSLF